MRREEVSDFFPGLGAEGLSVLDIGLSRGETRLRAKRSLIAQQETATRFNGLFVH